MKTRLVGNIDLESVVLEDIKIGNKQYTVEISSVDGGLKIDFNEGEFEVYFYKEGIRMNRAVYRPKHDHDDSSQLLLDKKKEKVYWGSSEYSNKDETCDAIEFGAITVEY